MPGRAPCTPPALRDARLKYVARHGQRLSPPVLPPAHRGEDVDHAGRAADAGSAERDAAARDACTRLSDRNLSPPPPARHQIPLQPSSVLLSIAAVPC